MTLLFIYPRMYLMVFYLHFLENYIMVIRGCQISIQKGCGFQIGFLEPQTIPKAMYTMSFHTFLDP